MKAFLLFLTIIILFSTSSNGQMKYWEDLSCSQKSVILESCKSFRMKTFYEGEFVPTDDDKTLQLLNEIVSSNDTVLPLSFYLINKICAKSDGALSEMVGEFCAKFLADHPLYILTYFTKERLLNINQNIIETYAMFVGIELYMKKKGISNFKYNYQSFKEALLSASKGNKENEETFKVFWQLVDKTIQNAD
jgi:hypothetical protein